jgi:type 1 glutamine amidotransferase
MRARMLAGSEEEEKAMRRLRPRTVVTATALGAALLVIPAGAAFAQGADTTPPVLGVGTLPVSPPQYSGNTVAGGLTGNTASGNAPGANGTGWYTNTAGSPPHASVILTMTATDDVAVAKFQYSQNSGSTYTDVPVATPGPSATGQAEITLEGNNTIRYRAFDTSGNVSQGATANTTLNQAAAVGATGVRLTSTSGRSAGDTLLIDTGANQELVTIASIPTPAPASPNPNVLLTTPLTKAHAAAAVVVATATYRTIAVPIDTKPPTATLPASVVNNHIGHSLVVTPNRTDPTPGSGATAVLDTWIDGTWVYPLPLDASKLSLGRHTWAIHVGDGAGLGSKVTFTFLVTTSFTDIDAMLTRYQTAGSIGASDVTSLRSTLTSAKASDTAGDKAAAINGLQSFVSQVSVLVPAGSTRDLLVTDAQDVIRQERGLSGPDETGLGSTSEAVPGAERHPLVFPAAPVHNANAKYRVLVMANHSTDFRHESIEDGEVLIQKLGAQYGFDVDIWDYLHPAQSVSDTPFTSAADLLSKYKVIIGDSSVGNNTLVTNYTMKNGTVVNEQAAFQGFIEGGGGYVAIHGADDSLHNWQWYKDMLGGLFVQHPSNAGGFGTNCGTCYWAELITEDNTNPATAGFPARFPVADELYHFDRKPRPFAHPLLDLNEATYATAIGVSSAGALENGDHPITWCRSYDGGRIFAQVLGHNWELFTETPWFQQTVLQGIQWTAGIVQANCVTYMDVKTAIAGMQTAGTLTPAAATAASADVDSGYAKYATLTQTGYTGALSDIDALRTVAADPASGDPAARAKVTAYAQQLKDWMLVLLGSTSVTSSPGGTVPATLSLSVGAPASFGAFTPGLAKTYAASTTANVISTAGDAALSVADPSATATGHLVNGAFALPSALQAQASSPAGAGGAFAPVGSSAAPLTLLTYVTPISNDPVTLAFQQAIGATDPLRTGSYSKTLTFTLSTTTP